MTSVDLSSFLLSNVRSASWEPSAAPGLRSKTLFVLSPSESLLGAPPFYTGRIPLVSRDVGELPPRLSESGTRFLLAPEPVRERIAAVLGARAVLDQTWTVDDHGYALFAVAPAVATSRQPRAD